VDIPAGPTDTIYIAAHAVVGNDFCDICDELVVETVDEVCIDYTEIGGDSYFEVTIDGETYPTWCVDIDHSMSLGVGPTAYPFCMDDVRLYSATCAPDFFPLPTDLTTGYGSLGGIDRPENLELVLWILNEWHKNQPAGWNVTDIQRVLWHLMEADGEVSLQNATQEDILAAALAAEIYPPACCDYVGVIIMPTLPVVDDIPVPDGELRQLAIMLVPAPCCETAWGDAFDGIQFSDDNGWAVYFSHDLSE
jgi:hypothetical protein